MKKQRGKNRLGRHFSQEGVALLAVAVATSLTGVLVAEFSTNTNVDMSASYNAADDMKLHFLARSGMNLGQLIIRVQTQILDKPQVRQFMGDLQLSDYTGLFMGAFGGSKAEVEGVANLLGGFAAEDMKGLGVPEGRFDVRITTDDNKINLNCARGGGDTPKYLYFQLANLFFPQAYDPIFQNEDAEGWRRDRETQATALIDYIDSGSGRFDPEGARGGREDYGYEGLTDKYKAKDNYLDSVGEIKLIRGVDDRFWSLFGDAFTVYGGCKLNVNAIEDPKLIATIIFSGAKQENDPAANNIDNIWALAQLVLTARGFGYPLAGTQRGQELKPFVDFVQNPQEVLTQFLGGDPASVPGIDPNLLTLLQQVRGVELDVSLISRFASAGPRRTYRVEAFAVLGDDDDDDSRQVTKQIIGVWDTDAPLPQNTRAPGNVVPTSPQERFGAWVYWREE